MNKRPHPAKNSNRHRRKKRGDGQSRPETQIEQLTRAAPVLRRYGIVFYETHAQAREDGANLATLKADCDQLNIVIRAEGSMDDPELIQYGKVYAGEAWTTIHKRRVDDGWYKELQE